MKAFRLTEWGQPAQYVTVPKPTPGPNDVLIRMKAAGLCRTDIDMVHSAPGSSPFADSLDAGYTLGHENAGYVAELGSSVRSLKVGEAVVVHHMRHCGNCEFCSNGSEQLCQAYKSPRGALWLTRGVGCDGGLAEYLLVPQTEVISIGDADPIQYAPLTDAAVTTYHAVRKVLDRLKPGTTVALIGIGGLGVYAVQFVKLLSAARIIAVDTAPHRLVAAKELGAHDTVLFDHETSGTKATQEILAQTGGKGVDVVIDMVGSASTLLMSSKTSRPRGSITLVGMEGGTLAVGWGLLPIGCEFSISLGSTRQDLREVCELMKQRKLRVDIQTFDFAEVQKAYDELSAGRLVGRAVVVFPDVPAVS